MLANENLALGAGINTYSISGDCSPQILELQMFGSNDMADNAQTPSTGEQAPPPVTLQLRQDEESHHAPAVSSPLNPDTTTNNLKKGAPQREQRERKESSKKREARGVIDNGRSATPDSQAPKNTKKLKMEAQSTYPQLHRLPMMVKAMNFEAPGAPKLVQDMNVGGKQFYRATDHVYNKTGYRYVHAISDPMFPHINYNRQTEVEPFEARFDYEDASSNIQFSKDGRALTTEHGWRSARANIGMREGRWYWEVKVLNGMNPTAISVGTGNKKFSEGHFRAGISRREFSLEVPVGYHAYSYGIRDAQGQKIHKAAPTDFLPNKESISVGDVIGFELNLPSLGLHTKVVEGIYNKAVDAVDDFGSRNSGTVSTRTLLRDRFPVLYKSELIYEFNDYQIAKEVEEHFLPPNNKVEASSVAQTESPHHNHPLPALRTLPHSSLKVYKNGRLIDTAFEDLLAFLPPASKPIGNNSREGLDDGTLAYYPTISVFKGGAVEANFGPNFAFPPPELAGDDVDMIGENAMVNTPSIKRLRPAQERYNEQIAEDVIFDLIDEVDLWMQDGGVLQYSGTADNRNGATVTVSNGRAASADSLGGESVNGEVKTLEVEE